MHDNSLKVQSTVTSAFLLRCSAPLLQNLAPHATDVLAALPLIVEFNITQPNTMVINSI
jgi:hypothetical protein